MDEMTQRVSIIQKLSEQLKEFLATLPNEAWMRPSACELWEVRDVVAHLTGGAERQIESMTRGRRGDAAPPPNFVSMDVATLSASNARRDIALRERLGDDLLCTFTARYDHLCELLNGFGAEDWEKPCWHARRGAMSARDYVDLRIQELAIHNWDIRSAFEPEAHLAPESVPVLVNIAPTWLWMSFRPGTKLSSPVVFRFEVTGAAPSSHDVIVNGDSFRVGHTRRSKPDVRLQCDSEAFLLFMYGRLSAASGLAAGRLAMEGDAWLVEQFEQWFKGL